MGEVQRTNGASNGTGGEAGSRHLIHSGETLTGIAKRYGVTTHELLAANRQIHDPNRIYAGQTLSIPAGRDGSSGERQAAAQADHYTVKRGDTLTAIAERRGVDLARLLKANLQIRNPNLIRPGQSIAIPMHRKHNEPTHAHPETSPNRTGGTLAPPENPPRPAGDGRSLNAILSRLRPDGANDATSRQDGLPQRGVHGVAASRVMAETDRSRVMRYKERYEEAARRYNLPPALLAAIASRESRGGAALDRNGEGDGGHGFGLMQVDNRNPFRVVREGGAYGQPHINQAAGILRSKLDAVKRDFPNLSESQQLFTAVSRYNGGAGRAYPNSDRGTTGGDYANDVIARAQYYSTHETWRGGGEARAPKRNGSPKGSSGKYTAAPSLSDVRGGKALLREGQQGEAVRHVQRLLDIMADGKFGKQTEGAVTNYQRSHGLQVDGIVGRHTLGSLERRGAPPERTGGAPERTHGRGSVSYNGHHVTDPDVRAKLQDIANFFGRRVVVTSGDRQQVVNGNTKSHHLRGRAADFHVEGLSLGEAYKRLKASGIVARDYQVIYHTEVTVAPHLHIGHWGDGRRSDFIVDTGQILPRR